MSWIITNILPFLIVLSILVFVHEWGHFYVARKNKVKVTDFSIGFGPELFGWTDKHQTRWKFSLIPLGGYVKMLGDADPTSAKQDEKLELTEEEKSQTLFSKTPLQRMAVAFAGPAVNIIFAIFILWAIIAIKGIPVIPAMIESVLENGIAQKAGLMAKDKVLKVDNNAINDQRDLIKAIRSSAGTDAVFEVQRGNNQVKITVPCYEMENGVKKPVKILGIKIGGEPSYIKHNPISAIAYSMHYCFTLSMDTIQALGMLITGKAGSDIGGIVSIGDMAAKSMQNGLASLMMFMAALSVSLGLFNLLPVPGLDGGHILLYGIEIVLGRPLPQKLQEYILTTGFFIIISVIVYVTWNDLMRYKVFQIVKGWFS